MLMEITAIEDDDDYELPSYRDKGNITVEVVDKCDNYGWAVDNYMCDMDASPFWVEEGMGTRYFVYLHQHDIPCEGYWTFEGVHGEYIKGDWGYTDDDEEWYYDRVRPATQKEIDELY